MNDRAHDRVIEEIKEPEEKDLLKERLRGLAWEWPELRAAADMYLAVLPVLKEAGPIAAPVRLAADTAREKLSRGEPLLGGVTLDFDNNAARDLMLRLAREMTGAGLPGMSRILKALEEDRLIPVELLHFVAERDYPSVAKRAEEQVLAPPLLWSLAEYAIRPALQAVRRELENLVSVDGCRDAADCYLCGAPASLGELRGNGQARHLRCGLCGASWLVPRLGCVYCGCGDHSRLGVISPDGRGDKVRVEVCDDCRGYLKVIRNFSPASSEELAVEDLSTLYLDCIAKRKGYRRPLVHV